MTHLEERMEADLIQVRDWLWKIGEDVEKALKDAKKILVLRDEKLAFDTVIGDNVINRDSRECDRLCHTFIARYLPRAGHLREMASTIRANIALERIGDYAVTIAREALQLEAPLRERMLIRLDAAADEAIDILRQARTAFRDGNAELAKAMIQSANRVQDKMSDIYEELFAEDDRMDGRTMMAVFVVFNLFKRVVDQAKNICDQTVFSVSGIAKIPRVYRILFLDQAGSDLAQLAVSIGRSNFAEIAEFASATPGTSDPASPALLEFLLEAGLPEDNLETEQLEALEHDFENFTVIVSLSGQYSEYISRIPFHTSAFNWLVPGKSDRVEQYRILRSEITDLVVRLAGESALRA
jgi:phosphate transport system protein